MACADAFGAVPAFDEDAELGTRDARATGTMGGTVK